MVETRLVRWLRRCGISLRQRFMRIRGIFPVALLCLLVGFYCGNIFASTLATWRAGVIWNGLLGLLLMIAFECLNSVLYKPRKISNWAYSIPIMQLINNWKIGFLLGIFVDSFKVAS